MLNKCKIYIYILYSLSDLSLNTCVWEFWVFFLTREIWVGHCRLYVNWILLSFSLRQFFHNTFLRVPPITWKIAKEIMSKQKLHASSTGKGGFNQGDCNRGERPKLRLKSTLLKQRTEEVFRTGKGRWVVTSLLCLLIGLTRRKSKLPCSFMTGGSFTDWSKGHTKVRVLLFLEN